MKTATLKNCKEKGGRGVKKRAGRPTKYCPEILKKAAEYCENWQELGDVIPMICGMANYIGIMKSTLELWEKDENKQEFSALCARVRAEQEQVLINKGLSRAADASLSKLLLRKHGYSDGQEIDHTTNGKDMIQSLTDEELAAKLRGLGFDPDAIK